MNLAIIQARMGSTRLAGKVLKPLGHKTVLENIIERISRSRLVERIVVATTINKLDDELAKFIENNLKTDLFRGSENDVLSRFYNCALKYKPGTIIRITADDPLKDPEIIDYAIGIFEDEQCDYCSNTIQPTYPEGLDVEVFSFAALEKAYQNAHLKSEREHVTPFIWKNPEMFKIKSFQFEEDLSDWRWTLDNEDDYVFMNKIYDHFKKNDFHYKDVIQYLKKNPHISGINNATIRNEGYIKSLKEDSTC